MASVDVSRAAIQKAMQSCVQAANELQNAAKKLKSQYDAAGNGWKDSKYKELGSIVSECNDAMKDPISKLGDCYKSLNDLDKIIEEYETA